MHQNHGQPEDHLPQQMSATNKMNLMKSKDQFDGPKGRASPKNSTHSLNIAKENKKTLPKAKFKPENGR